VRTASGAADALEQLRTFRPRLILMNPQMPGMDGLSLTQRLKADRPMNGVVSLVRFASTIAGATRCSLSIRRLVRPTTATAPREIPVIFDR